MMKETVLFVLFYLFATNSIFSQTGAGANYCCDESMYGIHHEVLVKDLIFNVYFVNTHNGLNQTYGELLAKIDSTLNRLPYPHLEIIERKRIVVGLPCKGGASRPCVSDPQNACILLSYESFRQNRNQRNEYECSRNPDHRPRRFNDAGSWIERQQSHLTLLHEVGHFVDYHYGITRGLNRDGREDCSACLSNDDCYSYGAKSHGRSEIIAQAYCEYFRRKTAKDVLLGGSDGDPRSGAHPEPNTGPNALFTDLRISYLIYSQAWDDWN